MSALNLNDLPHICLVLHLHGSSHPHQMLQEHPAKAGLELGDGCNKDFQASQHPATSVDGNHCSRGQRQQNSWRACPHCDDTGARSTDIGSSRGAAPAGADEGHGPGAVGPATATSCPLGALCPRTADMHLDSILAEAGISSKRSGPGSSTDRSAPPEDPRAVKQLLVLDPPGALGDDDGEDAVLQALRRYRAAAWW